MDLRCNLEVSISEGGTGMDTHGEPAITQDGNNTVPISTERGHDMQVEESGGGD